LKLYNSGVLLFNSHDLQVVEEDYGFMALADKLMAKAILIRTITPTS